MKTLAILLILACQSLICLVAFRDRIDAGLAVLAICLGVDGLWIYAWETWKKDEKRHD